MVPSFAARTLPPRGAQADLVNLLCSGRNGLMSDAIFETPTERCLTACGRSCAHRWVLRWMYEAVGGQEGL